MQVTEKVLEAMSTIIVEAGSLAFDISSEHEVAPEDRATLLEAASNITSTAQEIMEWLLDAPLELPRH